MRWVIFKAAICRRIMRRGDHDAIGESARAVPIVVEDRVRNYWRRRIITAAVDHRGHAVADKHLNRRLKGRRGERVGVEANEQGTIDAPYLAIEADGLSNREDVGFVE